jgi:hypothetical protein
VGGWLEAMVEVGRRVFPGGTSKHDLAPAHKMSTSFIHSRSFFLRRSSGPMENEPS